MKIIAVIPARAGSSGIPNKNIRLVNGKPLICYAIQNALDSKYITDIIVSSDSPEIKIISEQMGVRFKNRVANLCDAETTLDAVVFDALKGESYDIVVTMQPTSPTLKVESLDKAIEFFVENNHDTVISVINAPRLSWGMKDNKCYPKYEQRLNRQYLPKEYAETGAFVISKGEVVTEDSRIGKQVAVYEILPEEGIDIDDFSELLYAENVLRKQRIAFYVNGSNTVGMGHISRSLELADEFYCKPDIYFDKNQTKPEYFGITKHNLCGVDGEKELIQSIKEGNYNILIIDSLNTNENMMDNLKACNKDMKIICFEDDGSGASKADLVVNALYSKASLTNMYVGEKYYIAPKIFLFFEPIEIVLKVKKVFVSFGGADPQNYTERLLSIVSKKKYEEIHFCFAIGRAYRDVEKVIDYGKTHGIEIYYDVNNMPELMKECDLAITSRGRTVYELAMLGIPTISMAQNEREERHGFASPEHGFEYLGYNPPDSMIESHLDLLIHSGKKERQQMQDRMLAINLKDGRRRVMGLINSL